MGVVFGRKMGNAQTGTACPFPFASSNESNDSLDSCTETYGEVYDPGLAVFQVLASAFFSICLALGIRRLYLLKYAFY